MASLKRLLAFTAFFKLKSAVREHAPGETVATRTRSWDWSFDPAQTPEIRDLHCLTDDGAWPCVLERLQWLDPVVDTDFALRVPLRLGKEFIIKTYSGLGGASEGDPDLLDDLVESSLLVVYGFRYSPSEHCVKPLDDGDPAAKPDFENENFFSDFAEEPPPFEPQEIRGGTMLKVRMRQVKFLFAVELICCVANNRFEPTGAGRAARFYPRSYLLANVPCGVSNATTRLLRPEHAHHDHHGQHGAPAEQQDGGTHEYHSGLYTDSNFSPLVESVKPPKWPGFFSYYSFDDRRRYHVVKSRETSERSDTSSVMAFRNDPLDYYHPLEVKKVPRQGAFDNLHIAPAMVAPEVIRKKRQQGELAEAWRTLDNIMMAPVCHHDCFHMHWRWGAGLHQLGTVHYLKGWNADGAYREIGAPMIPPNQDLYIQCPQSHEALYTVETQDRTPALRWQVFMDHGAGYIVGMEKEFWLFDVQRLAAEVVLQTTCIGTSDVEPLVNQKSWAMFYWNMRYVNLMTVNPNDRAVLERLRFDDAQLQAVANL